jgi:hypothetical protein
MSNAKNPTFVHFLPCGHELLRLDDTSLSILFRVCGVKLLTIFYRFAQKMLSTSSPDSTLPLADVSVSHQGTGAKQFAP